MEPYSDKVRSLFDRPVHAGTIDTAMTAAIDEQGVRVRLYAAYSGDRVDELRFQAWGCPHLIAAAEAFCASYEDRRPADLEAFSCAGLMQSLPVPVEKTGRILVLEDAVRMLGRELRGALKPEPEED